MEELDASVLDAEGVTRARGQWNDVQGSVSVDPLASVMPSFSAYAYVYNSPVNFTDPTGMGGQCMMCGGGNGHSSRSSNEDCNELKNENQREIADKAVSDNIQKWFKDISITNPWAGPEIARSQTNEGLQIYHAGPLQRASQVHVNNLASILSRTYGGAGLVAASLGLASEVKYSAVLGTWLTQNGQGFAKTSFAGNENFTRAKGWSSRSMAQASGKILQVAGGVVTVGSIVINGANYVENDRSLSGGINFVTDAGVGIYSIGGGPSGVATGLGWEIGRGIVHTNQYQRWRRQTWLPLRPKVFNY